jgi:hypothetical protein
MTLISIPYTEVINGQRQMKKNELFKNFVKNEDLDIESKIKTNISFFEKSKFFKKKYES